MDGNGKDFLTSSVIPHYNIPILRSLRDFNEKKKKIYQQINEVGESHKDRSTCCLSSNIIKCIQTILPIHASLVISSTISLDLNFVELRFHCEFFFPFGFYFLVNSGLPAYPFYIPKFFSKPILPAEPSVFKEPGRYRNVKPPIPKPGA